MNQHFKRFRLVEEDEMLREKQTVHFAPDVDAELRMSSRIAGVIEDPTLNPELKLQLIRHFSNAKSKSKSDSIEKDLPEIKTQLPTVRRSDPIDADGAVANLEEAAKRQAIFSTAAETTPAATKPKARELAALLSKNPNVIDVSDNGEFVIQGKLIPNSNVSNTFRYIFNPGANRDVPIGFNAIIQTLANLNVPLRLISNRNARSQISDILQTGTGKRKSHSNSFSNSIPKYHSNTNSNLNLNSNPKKPIGFAKRPFNSLKLWKI